MGWIDYILGRRQDTGNVMVPPKTKIWGGGSTDIFSKYFGKVGRNRKTLATYREIYEAGGIISQAIDAYPDYMLMNGWKFDGKNKDAVEKQLAGLDLETIFHDLTVEALVGRDGIGEIQLTRAGSIYDIIPRPAESWDIDYDDTGKPLKYRQISTKNGIEATTATLEPEEVIHLKLLSSPKSVYGLSLIGRCIHDIQRDVETMEGATAAIRQCGYPTLDVSLGSPETGKPGDSEIDTAGREFTDVKSKNIFVHTYDTVIKNLNQGGITGLDTYNRVAIQRVCASMGVPTELLGLREGTSDATAVSRINTFFKKIDSYQRKLARAFNTQVVDKITTPGTVRIVFNSASRPTESEVLDKYVKIQSLDPLGSGRAVQRLVFDELGMDWDAFQKYVNEDTVEVEVPEPPAPAGKEGPPEGEKPGEEEGGANA